MATFAYASLPYANQYLCWSYDAFGNRTAQSQQPAACPAPAEESSLTPTESYTASNQIADGLHQYDFAGDVTADATTGNQYLYDGEEPIPRGSTENPGPHGQTPILLPMIIVAVLAKREELFFSGSAGGPVKGHWKRTRSGALCPVHRGFMAMSGRYGFSMTSCRAA